jgi:hypothetical protein
MFHGRRGLAARPERHLAPVQSVKYATFDARSSLIESPNPVGRMFYEFREVIHAGAYCGTLVITAPHPCQFVCSTSGRMTSTQQA